MHQHGTHLAREVLERRHLARLQQHGGGDFSSFICTVATCPASAGRWVVTSHQPISRAARLPQRRLQPVFEGLQEVATLDQPGGGSRGSGGER